MRKSGFFPRLALVNLMRNGRFYGPYLLSCGMTAAMYYILSYLTFSDIVASVRGAGYLQSLMYLGRLVVTLFSAVLLLYANSFVMKRRRRELGLYNILGLEKRHTARLMAEGMPEKQARAKASKQANEDARFVLPNACETKMVVTMNARSLMNFFQLRCCNRAQWEIRELAEKMFALVYPVAPHIFAKAGPACLCGPCPEGKMCCGKTAEVRAKYAAIKEGAAV